MTLSSAAAAAFLSTGLISLAPNILLFLFPNYTTTTSQSYENRAWLSLGQSLAVGGLLGDVFLHTLPHCFADASEDRNHDGHSHYDDHSHHHSAGGEIGLRVLFGFILFMVLDIIIRSLDGGCFQNHSHDITDKKTQGPAQCRSNDSPWRLIFSSGVVLNLIGDALHNFTDGLAIGATFAASHIPSSSFDISSPMSWISSSFTILKSRGGLASISIFLHEIPHELGDFATLVSAGMSRNMAVGMQFVTAIAAFIGTALGLFSSQLVEGLGHNVMLPFTAGGFVYLASVSILPEVLETDVNARFRLLQILSFTLGLGFMYAVGVLENIEAHIEKTQHVHHIHKEL